MIRTILIRLGFACAAALVMGVARAQVPARPADPVAPANSDDTFRLSGNRKVSKMLETAQDLLKKKQWEKAGMVLQSVLARADDVFLERTNRDKQGHETKRWVIAHSAALRLLDSMPLEGRAAYRKRFRDEAAKALDEAKKSGKAEPLLGVCNRFSRLAASIEAAELLADHYEKERQPELAVHVLEAVNAGAWEPTPASMLFRAARGRHRLGRSDPLLEKQLLVRLGTDKLTLAGRTLSADEILKELHAIQPGKKANHHDWPLFRGDVARSATAPGDLPFLRDEDQTWTQALIREDLTRTWIDKAVRFQESQGEPVLPAFFPVAASVKDRDIPYGLVVFRSYFGLHAVDVMSGKLAWEVDMDRALDALLNARRRRGALMLVNQWYPMYESAGELSVLYENGVVGAIATDGKRVYAIDDLAMPPHPNFLANFRWGGRPNFGLLEEDIHTNQLVAVALDRGKRLWCQGGRGKAAGALADTFFLGAPLPLGGRLYTLIETNSELKLACLDAADGKLLWNQPLGTVPEPLVRDPGRRFSGINIAYADGILVCPTDSGAIFGFDLAQRRVAWVHFYADANVRSQARRPGALQSTKLIATWKYNAPAIRDGKVVFTARDGIGITCLNLRDGSVAWNAAADEDLYLAGIFKGKVLLVGKGACRSLALADGKQLWKLPTGIPSGMGVANGSHYLLPLRAPATGEAPKICVLDLDRGAIHSHVRGRPGFPVGNLLFFQGKVLSQTSHDITAYQELRTVFKNRNLLLERNPRDAAALAGRAEIHAIRGDLKAAVADLVASLAENAKDKLRQRARDQLFDVLTELLRHDFPGGEKYLKHYHSVCTLTIPKETTPADRAPLLAEQRRRHATLHAVLAGGREKQGKLSEAFEHYVDFAGLADNSTLLLSPEDSHVHANSAAWAAAGIAALNARANPEERKQFERSIESRWQKLRDSKERDDLRTFVRLFGSIPKIGSEARFELANRLARAGAWLEAEQQYTQLRNAEPEWAARSIDRLATLLFQKGQPDDAIDWYRILARDFAKIIVRDGKTGADLYTDLASDPRWLPYLQKTPPIWKGKIRVTEEAGPIPVRTNGVVLEPDGILSLRLRPNRLHYIKDRSQLRIVEWQSGEEKCRLPLPREPNHTPNFSRLWNPGISGTCASYTTHGHLAVVPLGLTVCGIDLLGHRLLWTKNLLGANLSPTIRVIPDDKGHFRLCYPNGDIDLVGEAHFLAPDCLLFQGVRSLIALDPITGTVHWERTPMPPTSRLFGDGEFIYLVETNGKGEPAAAGGLRARDGMEVPVRDFSAAYSRHLRVLGRTLLVAEIEPKPILRLYDVQTGKDIWKKEYRPGTFFVDSVDPGIVGVLNANRAGRLDVLDVHSGKPLLTAAVNPETLGQKANGTLISDRDFYYLAINHPLKDVVLPWGGPWPGLRNGWGVPVNGSLHAFPRPGSRLEKWHVDMTEQVLILDAFQDLPIVLCTSHEQKLENGAITQKVRMMSILKRTGKILFEKNDVKLKSYAFETLMIDTSAGTIDLVGRELRIHHASR